MNKYKVKEQLKRFQREEQAVITEGLITGSQLSSLEAKQLGKKAANIFEEESSTERRVWHI
jgi:hypothetical protein